MRPVQARRGPCRPPRMCPRLQRGPWADSTRRQRPARCARRIGPHPLFPGESPMSLAGRVALVTGGGRGIGKAISLALAADGATIAVNYRRDEDAANATVEEITKAGGKAKAYSASVEVWEQDEAMVDQVIKDFGYIDILINNAGIASRGLGVADTDPLEMERVVRTHAFGPHYLSKLVLPSMRTR